MVQMKVGSDKAENLGRAEAMLREAAGAGAQVLALPEMFNCPYSNKAFPAFAEEEGGQSCRFLSRLAKELSVVLIGGSIPEKEAGGSRLYNTCFIYGSDGALLGKHRKAHLFDIDVKGGIRMKESDTLAAGDGATVVDTEFGKIGVAICYDVRFPELIRRMTLEGAELVVLPAAFNMTTGPAHWDLTMRTRALDNQIFFAAVSPARDLEAPYVAYGHSCLISPWGEFCAAADSREGILYGEVDTEYTAAIREQLPLLKHRRPELYGAGEKR
ncbi:MAG: carbon-nitrogen hydrolase family protein [Bacillota bacterium]|nr:carbon-nitrogen hydrolase family protein [Bacillota bacterium]